MHMFFHYLTHGRLLAVSVAVLFLAGGTAAAKGGGHGGGGGGGHGGGGGGGHGGGGYHGGGGFHASPSFHGSSGFHPSPSFRGGSSFQRSPSFHSSTFNNRVVPSTSLNRSRLDGRNFRPQSIDRRRDFDRFNRRFDFNRDFDRDFRRSRFFPGFFGFGWGWPNYYDYYPYNYDYGNGYSGDYGYPSSPYADLDTPAGYDSLYANEQPLPAAEADNVLIDVDVPSNAQVWFQGQKTSQTGTHREFESPTIARGRDFQYEIRVQWTDDGQTIKQTRHIDVRAGDHVEVSFRRPRK
jgi:uncharacterized protein (TIGR03000 family)